jgi:WD40 repeat protein
MAGELRSDYADYGELLQRVAEERHQSCVVLTSRELPQVLGRWMGEKVRSLKLPGVSAAAGCQLLAFDAVELQAAAGTIIEHYAGNPLALKIVAATLRELLVSDVAAFLALRQQGAFLFGDIQDLLARHCDRLPACELEVLYWLAIGREPLSLMQLQGLVLSPESRWKLPDWLASLQRRSLVETSAAGFSLQPAVMEYLTVRLLERVSGELLVALQLSSFQSSSFQSGGLLCHHALLLAAAKDYIREAQLRLLVEPVLAVLQAGFDSKEALQQALVKLLDRYRGQPAIKAGYIGGNIVNLLLTLGTDLRGQDLSQLVLWQVDLRSAMLHQTNFAGSDLSHSAFIEQFSNILSITFSPDGNTVIASDDRGWIHGWSILTGEKTICFQAHRNWIFAIAFSPDGQVLATSSLDRTIVLWDVAQRLPIQSFTVHQAGIAAIAFQPQATANSGLLASSSADQTIQVLDLATATIVHSFKGHQGIIRSVSFSLDGRFVVSGGLDHTIRLWDVNSGECLWCLPQASPIHTVTWIEDDIVAAGETGEIWIISSSGKLLQTLAGHDDRVWCLSVDAAGHLISAGDDRIIKVWEWQSGDCIAQFVGHQQRIWTVVARENLIASGGDDQTVRLWDLGQKCGWQTLRGYHNATMPIQLRDGVLSTFSSDQMVRIWRDGVCHQTLQLPTKNAFQAVQHEQSIASGGLDGVVYIFNVQTGEMQQTLLGHQSWVRGVCFSKNGKTLASAGGDQTIRLWDVSKGELVQTLIGHENPVQALAFTIDDQQLASGSWDCTIKLWDVISGDCIMTLVGHHDRITQLQFTPDSQHLVSSSQDGTVRLWDLRSQQSQILKEFASAVIAIDIAGEKLAIATQTGQLFLWDLAQECLIHQWQANIAANSQLLFSADGAELAIGGENGTCLIWSVADFGSPQILQVPRPYEGMNVADVTGVTAVQMQNLGCLGAGEGKDWRSGAQSIGAYRPWDCPSRQGA